MEKSLKMYTVFTPKSFLKKIYILSTVFNEYLKETAYAEIDSLNATSALLSLKKEDLKLLKTHKTIEDAICFHNQQTELANINL